MRITVELMAQLRDAAGAPSLTVECDDPCTVQELLARLAQERGGEFRRLVLDGDGRIAPTLMVAVGGRHVRTDEPVPLADSDTVLVGTPIAGG